jgi:hypothetical protein
MNKKDPKDLSSIPPQFFIRKQQTEPGSLLLQDPEELRHFRAILGIHLFSNSSSDFFKLSFGLLGRS